MKILLFVVLCFVSGTIGTHLSWGEMEEAINASYVAWTIAYNNQDVDAVVDLYTEHAINLPPGRPLMEGKEAMHASLTRLKEKKKWPHWKKMLYNGLVWSDGSEALSLTISKAENADDSYWIGKGVRFFRMEDGQMKIALSAWNSDRK